MTATPSRLAFVLGARFLGVIAIFLSGAFSAGAAETIRWRIADNNRIFMPGEARRYVDDLHTYMRCADALTTVPDKCKPYRDRESHDVGDGKRVLLPNLRGGAAHEEYRVFYDKASHAHPDDYASGTRRTLVLSLTGIADADGVHAAPRCAWRLASHAGEARLATEACAEVSHPIDLALSEAGDEMSFRAMVSVVATMADGTRREVAAEVVVRDFLIVALGDSYTSGEGNPERNRTPGTPAQWLDYRCHRSVFSYPFIATAAIALADPHHSVTLIHLACSGADIESGVLGPYGGAVSRNDALALWKGQWIWQRWRQDFPGHWASYGTSVEMLPPQVGELARLLTGAGTRRQRRPDVVLLSAGVNDLGLMPLLRELATRNCDAACLDDLRRRRGGAAACQSADRLHRPLICLDQRFARLRSALNGEIAPKRVLLMEYLDPLHDNEGARCMTRENHRQLLQGFLGTFESFLGWTGLAELSALEIEFADQEFFKPLKQALARAAEPPWTIVRPQGNENRRGFCGQRSWYHSYRDSKLRQHFNPNSGRDSVGTLHPNTYGHYFTAVRVLSLLRREGILTGHRLSRMSEEDFGRSPTPPDPRRGFAWYIWNKDVEDLASYQDR